MSETAGQPNPRVKEIFLEALELPPEKRAAFLDQRCGGDAEMRAQLESLLRAHELAGQFLAGPTVGESADLTSAPSAVRQIGPYRLLQVIGEGGFGTVWLAEQQHPVRRRVALKIIKLGMDTRQVVARFEAERQALAMMDHPNIAKVFDAGATEQGRPFFVMELVNGVPVTEYCDRARLTPKQRLELFVPVCHAVQHAHQKGIIHRDIKPTNVLVTLHDGKPVPKVIDFGIAKATQARLTEKTVFTEFRQMIGTPEYMSPEQAEMSGLDIDTRSDIYSLGVLLYELLTGTTPFDSRELRSKAYAEIQRVIREVDPPKPSTRLSAMRETLPSVAAQRNIEPRKLNTLVRGELDWIVMKCLEKDRTRRYESAAGLAADVSNYLSDEPVSAGSPSAAYRVHKFVRRHKIGIGVAASIAVALVVGLVLALYGLRRAVHAEHLANLRLEQVSREAAKSEAISNFLTGMLSSADPFRSETSDPTVRHVLESAAGKIDAGAFGDQPQVEAAVRTVIGRSFQSLGRADEAVAQLRRTVAMHRQAADANTGSPELAEALNLLGMALADQNQLDDAERVTREAMQMRQRLTGDSSREMVETIQNLASILLQRGQLEQAESLYRRAEEMAGAVGDDPDNQSIRLNGLAVTLARMGRLDEAEKCYRQAIEVERRSLGADSPAHAVTLSNLSSLLLRAGRFAEAEAPQREALRIAQATLPAAHPDIAVALNGLAQILRRQGKIDEAEALLRQTVAIERTARGENHTEVALALENLGQTLVASGQLEEAERSLSDAANILSRSLGESHRETVEVQMQLATIYIRSGRIDEAEQLYRRILTSTRAAPPDAFFRAVLLNYWDIPMQRGRYDEAEAISREILRLSLDQTGASSGDTALAQTRLAYVLARRNDKLDEAEALMRQALAIREKLALPREGWILQITRSLLGEILLRRGVVDEATPLITESYDYVLRDPAALPAAQRDARQRLILLYEKLGKTDDAQRLRDATTSPTTSPAK